MGRDVRFGRVVVVPALFVLAALLMLRPNPAHLTDKLAGNTGDPALVTWTLAWGAHTLAPSHEGSFYDANIFWPHAGTLAYADTLTPLIPAYGAVHALSGSWQFTLTALAVALALLSLAATYALARWLTGRRDAAIIGAFAFAFSSYALAQWGHLQLQTLGLLPLAVLVLLRLLERPTWPSAAALALVTAALALSTAYYGLAWAITAIVLVLAHARRLRPRTLGLLGVAAVAAIALAWPEVDVRLRHDDAGLTRPLSSAFALRGDDFLRPAFGSYVWGPLEDALSYEDEAHRFFPGVTVAVLAVVGGGAILFRRRGPSDAPRIKALPLTALVAAGLVAALVACGSRIGPVTGPFEFLQDHVPGFDNARATSRFAVVAVLAWSLLASAGFAAIAHRLRGPRAALVAAAVGAAVLAELAVPLQWSELPDDGSTLAVYRELARRPSGAVVELPMMAPNHDAFRWAVVEAPRMVYSTLDWHPRLNGYSGIVPPEYSADVQTLNAFPHEDAIRRARVRGVRYVILHPDAAPKLDELPPGTSAERHGKAWLVDLGPPPTARG